MCRSRDHFLFNLEHQPGLWVFVCLRPALFEPGMWVCVCVWWVCGNVWLRPPHPRVWGCARHSNPTKCPNLLYGLGVCVCMWGE